MIIPAAWPYRMRLEQAAAFCALSPSGFRDAVTAGKLPRPVHDGRIPFWYKDDLIRALDALRGGPTPTLDPFTEALEQKETV